MNAEELFKMYAENYKKNKDKFVPLTLEQFNIITSENKKIKKENEQLKIELEKEKQKYKEKCSKHMSILTKYNNLQRKTYNEIKKEMENEVKENIIEELENEYKRKWENKEKQLQVNEFEKIDLKVKNRISTIQQIENKFLTDIQDEINRYSEEHDLENENNKGYIIGLYKTRKILKETFESKFWENKNKNNINFRDKYLDAKYQVKNDRMWIGDI